jgi:arsenate reductase (thioredoxin)
MTVNPSAPARNPSLTTPARVLFLFGLVLLSAVTWAMPVSGFNLNPQLAEYIKQCEGELDMIPADRRAILDQLARYVEARRVEQKPIQVTFICTHNSRRSQFAQIWCAAAAAYYGIDELFSYSGGTEATAFNHRSIAALRRAGWEITGNGLLPNARFQVKAHSLGPHWECFSKVYHQPPNPQQDYCAVLTCSDADEACPAVPGAAERIALPYRDPRHFDDTTGELENYDAVCRQIAREMLYVFAQVRP